MTAPMPAPTTAPSRPPVPRRKRDMAVAFACGVFVAAMVGASYAAVPFYNWFCRTTGFGGIPQISKIAPAHAIDRAITVRFDANVGPGLPWRFAPEVNSIDLKVGEVATVYYTVVNESARVTEGQAAYNVSPPTVGAYFTKINCFCFTQQRLGPGEKRQMAVVFYVDPAMAKDSDQDDLNTITLSYTFYPVPVTPAQTPGSAELPAPGRKL
jgi:cytochrome c oxidase assembly protein subunit 11